MGSLRAYSMHRPRRPSVCAGGEDSYSPGLGRLSPFSPPLSNPGSVAAPVLADIRDSYWPGVGFTPPERRGAC